MMLHIDGLNQYYGGSRVLRDLSMTAAGGTCTCTMELGMLLIRESRLLLIDEPVAGMTQQEIEHTGELLVSPAGDHTVVVIEHDMDFVQSIARRVDVLHEGRLLAEGSMEAIRDNPEVVEVYPGE